MGMGRGTFSLLLVFCLFLLPQKGFSGASGLESEEDSDGLSNLEVDLSYLEKSLQSAEQEVSKNLEFPCDLSKESIPRQKEDFKKSRNHLSTTNSILTSLDQIPADRDLEKAKRLSARAQEIYKKALKRFETSQSCLFRAELHATVKDVLKEEKNKRLGEQLEGVADCLEKFPEDARLLKTAFSTFFDSIFDFFSTKKELKQEDCELLKNTYSVWASAYEQENEKSVGANEIPVYNVNNHNGSYYYWAEEQRKGRVPPEGLTIFHADTHTDMGHVHSHYWDHWSGKLLDLNETQKLLMSGKSVKEALLKKVNQEVSNPSEREYLQRRIQSDSEENLKSILEQNVRKTVHHIAQPLAAAQFTDTSNGKFLMCMPPWSKELPRSKEKETDLSNPIVMDFVETTKGEVGFEMDCKDRPKGNWNLFCRRKRDADDKILGKSEFQVFDCNEEKRTKIGTDSKGDPIYSTETSPGMGHSFTSYLKPEDREKGYLLDIDLDVFVSEGKGTFVEPISWERTTQHEKQKGAHGSHEVNTESDPSIAVTTKELDLIQKRMDYFFQNLKESKEAGFIPKVITLADSTALKRQLAPKKLGEDYNINGIQAYTPDCLVFLINYLTKKRLKEIFPNAAI